MNVSSLEFGKTLSETELKFWFVNIIVKKRMDVSELKGHDSNASVMVDCAGNSSPAAVGAN